MIIMEIMGGDTSNEECFKTIHSDCRGSAIANGYVSSHCNEEEPPTKGKLSPHIRRKF